MDFVGQISTAGKLTEISPAGKWWAAVPKNEWNLDDEEMIESIKAHWEDPYGDRRQELSLLAPISIKKILMLELRHVY